LGACISRKREGQAFTGAARSSPQGPAVEDESSRDAGRIHGALDGEKELGYKLYLVQDELLPPAQEGGGIGLRLEAKVQVVQGEVEVLAQAGRVAHQGAFAHLPGSHDRHHGEDPHEPFQKEPGCAGKERHFHA
jgi:hypothetical protein